MDTPFEFVVNGIFAAAVHMLVDISGFSQVV